MLGLPQQHLECACALIVGIMALLLGRELNDRDDSIRRHEPTNFPLSSMPFLGLDVHLHFVSYHLWPVAGRSEPVELYRSLRGALRAALIQWHGRRYQYPCSLFKVFGRI